MLTDDRISEQLRSYFEWLDDELGAIEPVAGSAAAAESTIDERAETAIRRHRRDRLLVLAACSVLVVGTVAAIAFVANDDVGSGPTTPSTADAIDESPAPAWYRMISPFLPPGFEHVTIHGSHDKYVTFEAFDPLSSKQLFFMVSRVAIPPDPDGSITLDQAEREPWNDPGADLNVTLPDGRQVGVYCTFPRPVPSGASNCPIINGDATDPDDIRALAVALAVEIDPSELPEPASTLDHVSTESIRAVTDRVVTFDGESIPVEAPHYSSSFVQFGDASGPGGFISVRTVTGFYPPLPQNMGRTTTSIDGYRFTWQVAPDGVLWSVSDNPTRGYDVANEILDIAIGAAGVLPTELPDGYGIWWIAYNGASGMIRPLDTGIIHGDREINWVVSWDDPVAREPHDEAIDLAGGATARFRTEPTGSQLITWQQESGTWIVVSSLSAAVDREQLIELANSFEVATPGAVEETRRGIADSVRATFDLARAAIIDQTAIEMYPLDGAPVALCVAPNRCEVALGAVGQILADDPVVGFNFQNPDGSADYYALFHGSYDRLEPSEGVTITTQPETDGTWVHAHRPADVPSGSVRVVNPSSDLGELIGFDV